MDYRVSEKDMKEIEENHDNIPEKEWLRLIFCELHEIKNLLKSREERKR